MSASGHCLQTPARSLALTRHPDSISCWQIVSVQCSIPRSVREGKIDMADISGFVAYPASAPVIGESIEAAVEEHARHAAGPRFSTWKESEVVGQFIGTRITADIADRDVLAADITRLNFNVTYEIGFAVGRRKRLLLIRNAAVRPDDDAAALGIFDTIGHREYENSNQLAEILRSAGEIAPMEVGIAAPNLAAPVYLLDAMYKTDQVRRIL